jgi:hypothetical protein
MVAVSVSNSSGHNCELEVLLQSSRMVVSSTGEERIRNLLRKEIDWDFLIRTAHCHRVLPLLYQTLCRIAPDSVPERVMTSLRKRFHANAQRNLFMSAELLQVLDLLEKHHIRAIPYKGPVLSAALYGDVSLRQFSDLDIIVPATDVSKARTLLVSRGYRTDRNISEEDLCSLIQTTKDLILRRDNQITLELHWGITENPNPIDISPDFLWRNVRTFSVAGRTVNIHAPEDLLLILCIHGGKHRWEYLVWLCDIAELIRSYPALNWMQVIETASNLRARRILLLGLLLARDALGAELPEWVSSTIGADHVLNELGDQLMACLAGGVPLALQLGENQRYYMKLREHRADRFLVAWKQVKYYLGLTARDREILPESSPLLLYVVRPFRLAWEHGLRPFRRFFRGLFESWRE